jgi:hypothetical protein
MIEQIIYIRRRQYPKNICIERHKKIDIKAIKKEMVNCL